MAYPAFSAPENTYWKRGLDYVDFKGEFNLCDVIFLKKRARNNVFNVKKVFLFVLQKKKKETMYLFVFLKRAQ